MQQIPLAAAAPGMVLARAVLVSGDRVLCGKGTQLTEAIIDRLRHLEIGSITVEGHPLGVEGEKTLEEQLADLDERFSRVQDIPPLMYLKMKIRERLIAAQGR
ncbi:MAG: hypothetical protein AB1634_11625 [Thermodesulfobacteriota bacterium]